jgi:hypothetical protein
VFDNDDALDLLGTLAGQEPARRRRTLERILRRSAFDLDYFARVDGPGGIVAAVAVVAAGLPPGEAIARQIAGRGYDTAAVVIPEDPALADDALTALLVVAGHDPRAALDGAWHYGWADAETALRARQATDELASVFTVTSTATTRNCPWNGNRRPLHRAAGTTLSVDAMSSARTGRQSGPGRDTRPTAEGDP